MRLSNTTTRFLQNNKHIKERQSQFFRNIHAYVSYESVNSTDAEHLFILTSTIGNHSLFIML